MKSFNKRYQNKENKDIFENLVNRRNHFAHGFVKEKNEGILLINITGKGKKPKILDLNEKKLSNYVKEYGEAIDTIWDLVKNKHKVKSFQDSKDGMIERSNKSNNQTK